MRDGVRDVLPEAEVRVVPMADGGEGTLDAIVAAGGRFVRVEVPGPRTAPVPAGYAVLDGTAYVEAARACGLAFVDPTPASALAAHTWGVGTLLGHAVAHGARGVVLAVGGTATTDGGAGMLQALGCRLLDANGGRVGLGGRELARVTTVELAPVRARLGDVAVQVATDVRNPLVGPRGAAEAFGPQKGPAARR